jgi:hypothetical protein
VCLKFKVVVSRFRKGKHLRFKGPELLVISNDMDKNTFEGESSKSGCDVLEFHYSSTYDVIHRAPTNILRK